jgi:hypothetical protein
VVKTHLVGGGNDAFVARCKRVTALVCAVASTVGGGNDAFVARCKRVTALVCAVASTVGSSRQAECCSAER